MGNFTESQISDLRSLSDLRKASLCRVGGDNPTIATAAAIIRQSITKRTSK